MDEKYEKLKIENVTEFYQYLTVWERIMNYEIVMLWQNWK